MEQGDFQFDPDEHSQVPEADLTIHPSKFGEVPRGGAIKRCRGGPNRDRLYYTRPDNHGRQRFGSWVDGKESRGVDDVVNERFDKIEQLYKETIKMLAEILTQIKEYNMRSNIPNPK
jgi:glycine/D-amino acid oxidase-like deaminating enzyme